MSVWSKAADILGTAAPLIGGLLLGPAGATAGTLLSSALGVENTPEAVTAELQQNPDAILEIAEIESQQMVELQRLTLQAETRQQAEINETMRVEAKSDDPFVRRWRPFFGYIVAIAWLAYMGGVTGALYYAIGQPNAAAILPQIATVIAATSPIWGIALAVLGVNVSKRSQDKQVAAGQAPPPGVLGALAQRILPGAAK